MSRAWLQWRRIALPFSPPSKELTPTLLPALTPAPDPDPDLDLSTEHKLTCAHHAPTYLILTLPLTLTLILPL